MKVIEFKEQNIKVAEKQEEYETLPAHVDREGVLISCWEFSDEEIETLKKTKVLWFSMYTFGGNPMPVNMSVDKPELKN